MPASLKNIIILISGEGSNMRAIVETARRDNWQHSMGAQVAAVISNRPDAPGLAWARSQGIAAEALDHKLYGSRDAFDEALASAIDRHDPAGHPALVLLAGFMRILTPGFVRRYEGRLLNIHPSLLPAYPGLHTHQRALAAGDTHAGATVHRVTAELDYGPVLAQARVPVLEGDTAQTLADRVLVQEHRIYPAAVVELLRGMAHDAPPPLRNN
jgi:phosphoribosylglycinamide formyltransferase 1